MVVDIAPQQQLTEVFTTNRNHYRSSTSSSTYKRNPNPPSNSNTMTNGHRFPPDELSKKAEQILGHATSVVDYSRQQSMEFSTQQPSRLNITASNSRVKNPPIVNNHHLPSSNKDRRSVTVEQLVPFILKLITPPTFPKLPEAISGHSKSREAIIERENSLNLSDDENEDVDSDNANTNQTKSSGDQVSIHRDTENDDETNQTNPNTFSLSYFIPTTYSPLKSSPIIIRKRSLSPSVQIKQETKRKHELIRSFSSSVNIPIDIKQPILPITIPTYLFFDHEDDKSPGTSKRYVNGSIKDTIDSLDSSSTTTHGTQQKKNKTSHLHEKTICKQESSISSTIQNIEEESNTISDFPSSTVNTVTVVPMITQPKKEKPTANVKPLLQSTPVDISSLTTNNSNVVNPSDRLTTTTNATNLSSRKINYSNLKNMSTKELNLLARKKKKQADSEKRTFDDVKQSMSLYLESVCYFIQCANDEPILEQRTTLLTATLAMLQHLAHNYQKMFHISTIQSVEPLNNIRQKFLLIDYWLQALIYQLQYNINLPSIERCANQVTEYFNQFKSPSDINNYVYDFSKYMLNSYHSNYYWNKAERLMRDEPLKKFNEQLCRQNQNRRLTRDDATLDFILYIFDAIDLLRLTTD